MGEGQRNHEGTNQMETNKHTGKRNKNNYSSEQRHAEKNTQPPTLQSLGTQTTKHAQSTQNITSTTNALNQLNFTYVVYKLT